MSHWLVYWILMLDNISKTVSIVFGISIGVIFIVGLIHAVLLCDPEVPYGLDHDSRAKFKADSRKITVKSLLRFVKYMSPIIIVLCIVTSLIPSTKQMAAIYLIPKIAANKDIQQLPPKLSKLALQYVNQELNLEEGK